MNQSIDKVEIAPMSSSQRRWWNDKGARNIAIQVIVLGGLALAIYFILSNTSENLRRLGIPFGFSFLTDSAGFPVSFSLIPVDLNSSIARLLLVGILNTLLISAIGVVFATILGFIIGTMRMSKNPLIAMLGTIYVELLRNIPLLLQIIFWYVGVLAALPNVRSSLQFLDLFFINQRGLFMPRPVPTANVWPVLIVFILALIGSVVLIRWAKNRQVRTGEQFPAYRTSLAAIISLPTITGLLFGQPFSWDFPQLQGFNFSGGLVILPEMLALALALILYHAAFIAENVRSGLIAVSKGQWEAAMALDLTRMQILRFVVIPQALRVIVPPLGSQFLNVVKNSTLAVAIGYPDMVSVFAGTVLNQTGRAVECIVITMLFYLTVSLIISLGVNLYNRRVQVAER